ncbi:hypothetical protein AB0C12_32375 [Actinoplanes sp. NPDC048967]|uniref:hypothetical protein n=1 Tax=Actinoplanes sp. NPDC048967 TaxID=3155269 RepID=UPI0033C860F5
MDLHPQSDPAGTGPRHRRTALAVGGSAFAVAAIVAAFSFAGGPGAAGQAQQPADRPAVAAAATQLVSYTGRQPKGFSLDKVPDGWFVQADDASSIVLAPRSAAGGPKVDPSANPLQDPRSFVGKIAVMLQSKDQKEAPAGKAVKVGDHKGVLVKGPDNSDGRTLWVEQPSGTYLLIQFWDGIGLSQDAMVDFGAGVHVEKGAQQGVG